MPDAVIDFPPYRLDLGASRLWRGASPVPLRPKAWALLCYLAARPGVLVSPRLLVLTIPCHYTAPSHEIRAPA